MTLGEKDSPCLTTSEASFSIMERKPLVGAEVPNRDFLNGGTGGMKLKQTPRTRLKSPISAPVACICQLSSAPKWSTASNNSDINGGASILNISLWTFQNQDTMREAAASVAHDFTIIQLKHDYSLFKTHLIFISPSIQRC